MNIKVCVQINWQGTVYCKGNGIIALCIFEQAFSILICKPMYADMCNGRI